MSDKPSKLKIADREFTSRLLVGTGKFASNELMRDALEASGTELVTVALRRADLSGRADPFANILDFIDPKRFLLLPNTSGARNADEAIRLARLSVSAGLPSWIKLEIHPDPRYLLPIQSRLSRPRKHSLGKDSRSCPTSMPTLSWRNVCRMLEQPP